MLWFKKKHPSNKDFIELQANFMAMARSTLEFKQAVVGLQKRVEQIEAKFKDLDDNDGIYKRSPKGKIESLTPIKPAKPKK